MPRRNKNAGKHSENNHSQEHIMFEENRHNKKHWQKLKRLFQSSNLIEINVNDFITRTGISSSLADEIFNEKPVVMMHPDDLRKLLTKHDIPAHIINDIPGAHEVSHKATKEHLSTILSLPHTLPDKKHPTRAMNKRAITKEINQEL